MYANIDELLLNGAGIKMHQYVASCSLGGRPCNITRDFKLMFHPYYFNCYTYNRPKPQSTAAEETNSRHHDGNSDEDLPWLMPGLDNGLSLVVLTGSGMVDRTMGKADVLAGLYDVGGPTAGSDGLRVMIHPHNVVPVPLAEGFDVPPGSTASLSVRPRRNKRIGPPHGDCISKDPFISPSREDVYRQLMCQQRCLQQHIRDRCRCYDISLPVEVWDADPCLKISLPSQCSESPDDIEPCIEALLKWYERLKCAKRVREKVQEDRAEMSSCHCRAACNELLYDVSFSMARWPAPGFEADAVYDDIFKVNHFMENFGESETIRRHFNETGDRTKALQDFARINVYVADAEVGLRKHQNVSIIR